MRVHSTATNPDRTEGPVTLFTSERYDRSKHVYEQLTDQLGGVAFSQDEMKEGIAYFGINPPFVTQGMNGKFQSTIILMMGCEGLDNTLIAEAFVEKGARAYVSWNGSVSSSHTDQAATQLLKHMVTEGQTISQAVENTAREVGPDKVYDSILKYYPLASGNYAIQG